MKGIWDLHAHGSSRASNGNKNRRKLIKEDGHYMYPYTRFYPIESAAVHPAVDFNRKSANRFVLYVLIRREGRLDE